MEGRALSLQEAEQALELFFDEDTGEVAIASFLTALSMKGETSLEIAGFARTMRRHALSVRVERDPLVDTAGTGGGLPSFNISTTAAFVIAGAGVAVAKHGNRAVTSRSGSADMLEALGVRIDPGPEVVQRCVEDLGIGFLFAPDFHPAMKRVAGIRKRLAHRSIFNLLGPLTNPLGATRQLIGVFEASLTGKLAQALLQLGAERAWVVHSLDGMDELSTRAPTRVSEVVDGEIREFCFDPATYGLSHAGAGSPFQAGAGDPHHNALLCRSILEGRKSGELRDIVVLNAAAALHLGGDCSFRQGVEMAMDSIASGQALSKVESLVERTTCE